MSLARAFTLILVFAARVFAGTVEPEVLDAISRGEQPRIIVALRPGLSRVPPLRSATS